MSRYIDADKLIKSLERGSIVIDEKVLECKTIHDELVYLLDKVSDFVSKVVHELPTVDVVEVPVRCEDCEHHEATDIRDDTIYCHQYTDYRGIDEFCSRGEKITE